VNAREFYDYIVEHFNLGGPACRLIGNILAYIEAQQFEDEAEAQRHLWLILNGAIGLTRQEIEMIKLNGDEPMKKKRQITITWAVEDVLEIRPDLTEDQAMEVLENVEQNHDAEVGICWDTLAFWADSMFRRAEAEDDDDEAQPEKAGELDE